MSRIVVAVVAAAGATRLARPLHLSAGGGMTICRRMAGELVKPGAPTREDLPEICGDCARGYAELCKLPAVQRRARKPVDRRWENMLAEHLRIYALPAFAREFRFHPVREWRFDFAWPQYLVAAEVDGGGWTFGRHNRPRTFAEDLAKMAHAQLLGWVVFRCTPQQVADGYALRWLRAHLLIRSGALDRQEAARDAKLMPEPPPRKPRTRD